MEHATEYATISPEAEAMLKVADVAEKRTLFTWAAAHAPVEIDVQYRGALVRRYRVRGTSLDDDLRDKVRGAIMQLKGVVAVTYVTDRPTDGILFDVELEPGDSSVNQWMKKRLGITVHDQIDDAVALNLREQAEREVTRAAGGGVLRSGN